MAGIGARIKSWFGGKPAVPQEKNADIQLQKIIARCGTPSVETEGVLALRQLVAAAAAGAEIAPLVTAWLAQYDPSELIGWLGVEPAAETGLPLLWDSCKTEPLRYQLLGTLRHETPNAALAAARVIPGLNDALLVPLLLQALLDENTYILARVGEALAGAGSGAANAMAVLAQKEDCTCRALLLEVFAAMPETACPAPIVTAAFQDPDPWVRLAVTRTVAAWGSHCYWPQLTALVADEDFAVRAAVAVACGSLGGSEALACLEKLEAAGDWQTAAAQKIALTRLGQDSDPHIVRTAVAKKNRANRSRKSKTLICQEQEQEQEQEQAALAVEAEDKPATADKTSLTQPTAGGMVDCGEQAALAAEAEDKPATAEAVNG